MKIGLTFDLREDYNIESTSEIYADFSQVQICV